MKKHKIEKSNLLRHKDITRRKWDISDLFWNKKYSSWDEYKNSLNLKTNKKKMTKKYFKELIIAQKNQNSVFWNLTNDKKQKKLLEKLNGHIREFLEKI